MSEQVHAQFTAGMDPKKFESGCKDMRSTMLETSSMIIEDMRRTQRATDAMSGSVVNATRRLHAMGNASAQIQDIAVQLQAGTKALTVFTQQVPQLLSAFGPWATVAATVIAIGAALYTWASGATEAAEASRVLERNAKASANALEKVQSVLDQANQARANASGKEQGIDEKYNQQLAELAAAEKLVKYNDAAGNAKITEARAAVEAARAAEKEAEAAKQSAKAYKEIDDVAAQVAKEWEKLEKKQLQGAARMMQLGKEITESEEKLRSGKLTSLEHEQEKLKLLKAQNEVIEVHRALMEENKRGEEKQLQTQKEITAEFDKRAAAFEKQMRQVEKYNSLQEKLEKEERKAEVDKSAARGNAILKDISNRREGISSADIRKSAIRAANEEKRAIDRQLAKEGVGQGMDSRRRESARRARAMEIAGDINAAKNADKIKAEIDGNSIKQLRDEIKNLLNELLPE